MEALQYFFSYARRDSAFVLRLAQGLREEGINLWLDQLDILGGQRWDRAVEEALQTCQGMIAVLSPDALASNNVMDEVSYALEERKIVIPILLHSCTIPFRLRRVQYIDFTADYQTGFAQLLRALRIDQPSPPRAPAVPEDTVVQDGTVPSQETPREVPTREQLPRRAYPPEPASAVPEETLETGGAALIQPPLEQVSHGDGRPFDAVPQQKEAAPPPVREKDRPEVHRRTTSDTRAIPGLSRCYKRLFILVGGVLLCGLVTALYLVLSGQMPSSRPPKLGASSELLVGTWRFTGVELGQPMDILWHLRPDGTETYIVNGAPQGAGTWRYRDAHIYERYPDGRQGEGAIQILDRDHFVVTIVESDVPAQTGVRRLYVRQ
jgi:TIR domain